MKKYRLKDLVVPWGDGEQQRNYLVSGVIAAVLISTLSFWSRLQSHMSALYDYPSGAYIPGRAIPTYIYLLSAEASNLAITVFFPFTLVVVGAILLAVWNYLGFRRETKSVYLMKRLPDRWELSRRCLALPLLTLLACGVLVPLLTGLFYGLYLYLPPPEAIPPDNGKIFWANIRQMFYPFFSPFFFSYLFYY